MRLMFRVITVFSRENVRFDYKKNHRYSKLANFQLDIIVKINCKTLIIISYTSLELKLRNVQTV